MSDVATAVAGTIADLFGESPAAAEETPNSPTDAAALEAQDAAFELPNLNPSLPDDLVEFLDEPDFDEEITASSDEVDEFVDPDELARQNAQLKKRLEYVERQKLEATQKAWSEEAKKIAPLSRPETIKANSRRAFLREARKQHEDNFSLLAPHIEAYKTARESLKASIEAEIRSELADAWGKPNVGGGPSGAPIEAVEAADKLDRARNTRNMTNVVKALMEGNRI